MPNSDLKFNFKRCFLCSACLLCSLGSFAVSADDELTSNVPVKIATAYVQGHLGIEPNHIMLDGATIDDTGLMSNGTIKYYTTATENRYSKGIYENKTLDEIWAIFNENWPDQSDYNFSSIWEPLYSKAIYLGYEFDDSGVSTIVKFPDGSTHSYSNEMALRIPGFANDFYSNEGKAAIEDIILSVGWELSSSVNLENYSTLQNSNENSILGLSLKSGDDYVGATEEIDLTNKNFSLGNVQFYNSTTGDVIEDESSATPLSCKPGVYDVMGILTKKGDKTIISDPVAKSSDES